MMLRFATSKINIDSGCSQQKNAQWNFLKDSKWRDPTCPQTWNIYDPHKKIWH